MFPMNAPQAESISPMYQPNIDAHSRGVCINLWHEWLPSFGLQDAIEVSLLGPSYHNPTLEICIRISGFGM